MDKKNVLLVEDDTFIRSYPKLILERAGYNVFSCDRIEPARISIEHVKFDMAVLDGMLPDGSGVSFAEELDCPVLFVSGVNDEGNLKRMWKLGTVFPKPVNSALAECIARVMK